MFIVFEGIDGSGTTTQKDLLFHKLIENGKLAVATGEPTTEAMGLLSKEILQNKQKTSPEALQLLFCADRADHVYKTINPALKEGKTVVSDRYFWSTIVFGGLSCDREWLKKLNEKFPQPDIIFYLQIEPNEALKRVDSRGLGKELFEKEDVLKRVSENYQNLIQENKDSEKPKVYILDANQSIESLGNQVFEIIKKYL